MVDDMVLEDESTEAGVEVPDETWERLLTRDVDLRALRGVRDRLRDLVG